MTIYRLRVWGGPRDGEEIKMSEPPTGPTIGGYRVVRATDRGRPVMWAVAPGYTPLSTTVASAK